VKYPAAYPAARFEDGDFEPLGEENVGAAEARDSCTNDANVWFRGVGLHLRHLACGISC
jgi:hypothetical protein